LELENALAGEHAAGATISARHAGVQGMGGVGKTALAVVLAHRLAARCPDAQLFVNLRGAGADEQGYRGAIDIKPVTPAEAMQSVIHFFHPEERLPETPDALAPIYRSVLAEAGRVLLLLDNAAGAAQVRPLLPPPNCLLLVTSRAQFQLPGLATRNLDCLAPEKSRELLLRLAPRLQGGEIDAAELCGHLPLALEVFAGAVNDKRLTPVSELVERLRARLERLTPVDAAFQVSYELLDEEFRRQWTLLAVFPASFDLAAGAAVWNPSINYQPSTLNLGEARDAMQALVNASLVEWNESNARFRLHDLVRQFCDGKLTDAERDAARLRHARHFRDVADEADALYKKGGADVLHGLELFDRERAQIEAAFDWLQPRRDHDSATLLISLVNAVAYTGSLRFHPRQRIRWLETQHETSRITGHRGAEGDALGNLGLAYKNLGDARKAIEFYEQALLIDRDTGNRRGEGATLGNLGNAYADLGDARKAIEFYEQALVIDREIGDRRGEGAALGNLGSAHYILGDARKAIEFYEQNRDIAREVGDRRGEGNALGNLGNAYADLDDARKAIEFYEQQLVIAREIGDRLGEGNALWNYALAVDKQGDRAQSIARAEAALRIYDGIEDPNGAVVRAALAEWRGRQS